VDWINLATGYGHGQVVWTGLTWPRATDRDRWWALVNAVTKVGVP
jgi:hypothetical protein